MGTDAPSAHELTRRLVAQASAQIDAPESSAVIALAACERTYRDLARSFGATGALALLTRALAQAQVGHPVLKDIRVVRQAEPMLDKFAAAVDAHGASAVAAGLEAVLEELIGLLGRLIGNDMVVRLVDQGTPNGTHDDEDVR